MKNSDNLIHSFNHTPDTEGNFHGLTKREYFAGLAMQGWIACQSPGFRGEMQDCAKKAIEYADELLKQLEK